MSGTTTNTFYIPVGDCISKEQALKVFKNLRKDPDGVIRHESESKPKK
jgi:hypothetical protein